MSGPKFSVVVPLYNKEKYIQRAISSVLNQTFSDWECIVVDDGSTDGGPDKVRAFRDPRIRLVSQKNKGPSAARNLGARHAEGEWIALLDADDYWLREHLKNLSILSKEHPQCHLLATNFYFALDRGRIFKKGNIFTGTNFSREYECMNIYSRGKQMLITSSSVSIRRALWVQEGGFREWIRLAEDIEFWIRLSLKSRLAVCLEPSSVYWIDTEGSTRGVFFVGDAPFLYLKSRIPSQYSARFRRILAMYRIHGLSWGNLFYGNNLLVRKMAFESALNGEFLWGIMFYFLSWVPRGMMGKIYRVYRNTRGLGVKDFMFTSFADKR